MIFTWLAARVVPIGAGLALVVALVAWDRVRIWNAESRGAEKVVAQSRDLGNKINAKNADVREHASRAGAPERVLKRFCRDC
jgi:hypothetical protein